jgi:uncharacterized protein YjbJ (UPF0337 family)
MPTQKKRARLITGWRQAAHPRTSTPKPAATAGPEPVVEARNDATLDERDTDSTTHEGSEMNWDRIEGNWKQFKGNVKEQWSRLTDAHLDVIAGKREQLAGKIQEMYGISREVAEKQIAGWQDRVKDVHRAE